MATKMQWLVSLSFLHLFSSDDYLELTFQLAIGGGTIINSTDDGQFFFIGFVDIL